MMTDAELLRSYMTDGSEKAFTEVVNRHLNLVYSTALRLTNGDAPLAQEVAQTVFTDLARKASKLSDQVVLSGWLYTSTRYAAAKAVRSECTRRRYEQEAHVMNESHQDAASDINWSELRHVLDGAMSELSDADRAAVLLRYFEHRNLADIGSTLGCGEDAARKRVARALDRLRNLLAARGIKASAAALSVALATHAVHAAPTGLAATLAGTSLAAATTTISTLSSIPEFVSFMAPTKLKIGLAATVLATAGVTMTVIHHQRTATMIEIAQSDAKERLQAAQQAIMKLVIFASGGQRVETLEQAGVTDDRFELVFRGALPSLPKPAATIVIREKAAGRTPEGRWARAYGFADGHAEVGLSDDGDFEAWEKRRSLSLSGIP
jgi:RNA polymerase sigma factor (sigma-70 family)